MVVHVSANASSVDKATWGQEGANATPSPTQKNKTKIYII